MERIIYLKNELKLANQFISDPKIRIEKYEEMKESAFNFYRATTHLFYKDLGMGVIDIPAEWKITPKILTWIVGDLHTQNIGFFENRTGTIVFDVNDFDESYIAPFYWDLIRIVTSIFLQKDLVNFKLSHSEAKELSDFFLHEYQDNLRAVEGNSSETVIELTKKNTEGIIKKKFQDLESTKSNEKLLSKWTIIKDEKRIFDLSNPELLPIPDSEWNEIQKNWTEYLKSLGNFYPEKGENYFRILDKSKRINSGLGSKGLNKYFILINGQGNSENIILEIKEQKIPSLFLEGSLSIPTYNSFFSTHANRTVTAIKEMLVNPDPFIGSINTVSSSYLVRRVSPYKFGFKSSDFSEESDFHDFLKYTARAVAYVHSRSDIDHSATYINYNFEDTALNAISEWSSTKTLIRNMGEAYANQVLEDYQYFLELLNNFEL